MPNASVPIVPSKLAHFVLRTRRYAELIAWYRTVLGAKPVFESPFVTFLTGDSEHHRIAIANAPHFKDRPGPRRRPRSHRGHLAERRSICSAATSGCATWASSRPRRSTTGPRSPCTTSIPTRTRSSCRWMPSTRKQSSRRSFGPTLREEPDRGGLRPGGAARALEGRRDGAGATRADRGAAASPDRARSCRTEEAPRRSGCYTQVDAREHAAPFAPPLPAPLEWPRAFAEATTLPAAAGPCSRRRSAGTAIPCWCCRATGPATARPPCCARYLRVLGYRTLLLGARAEPRARGRRRRSAARSTRSARTRDTGAP